MELWLKLYKLGWAKKEDLQRAVLLGQLTPAEYEEITGEAYTS